MSKCQSSAALRDQRSRTSSLARDKKSNEEKKIPSRNVCCKTFDAKMTGAHDPATSAAMSHVLRDFVCWRGGDPCWQAEKCRPWVGFFLCRREISGEITTNSTCLLQKKRHSLSSYSIMGTFLSWILARAPANECHKVESVNFENTVDPKRARRNGSGEYRTSLNLKDHRQSMGQSMASNACAV